MRRGLWMLTQGLARMVDEYPMAVCAGFPDDRARRTRGFGVLGQGSVSDCPVQHHSPPVSVVTTANG